MKNTEVIRTFPEDPQCLTTWEKHSNKMLYVSHKTPIALKRLTVSVSVWKREGEGERDSNVIRWQLTAESCNIEKHPENLDSKHLLEQDACFFTVSNSNPSRACILYNSNNRQNKHKCMGLWGIERLQNAYYDDFFPSPWYKWIFSYVLLQLCLVSILGFVLYGITYLPDERTSVQFICKVSLQTCWHIESE